MRSARDLSFNGLCKTSLSSMTARHTFAADFRSPAAHSSPCEDREEAFALVVGGELVCIRELVVLVGQLAMIDVWRSCWLRSGCPQRRRRRRPHQRRREALGGYCSRLLAFLAKLVVCWRKRWLEVMLIAAPCASAISSSAAAVLSGSSS
eukprot:728955-Pleurochrysis_carterae.AAC.1